MASFNISIISPQKKVFSGEAEFMLVRTKDGNLGILANHAPLVTELALGEMTLKISEKTEEKFYISGGFLEVSDNKVKILADEAMKADEIDIENARKEKEVIEAKLKKLSEDKEIAMTQKALQEALTKIKIGEGLR